MSYAIGESAGRIWQYLNDHPSCTCDQINRDLKLDTSLLFMSLGWLAGEDKLAFDGEGKKTKFSLR